MPDTPLIVVTNDDGILADGIVALAEIAAELGEVLVCAPDTERSGSSHAITFHTHLRAHAYRDGWWRVSGTPVDCTYLALHHLCRRRPSLVLSGINAGFNLGTDVFYSGTVGGAAEATLRGIPAIAVSVDRGIDPRWAVPVVRKIAERMLDDSQPDPRKPMLLNVNVPAVQGLAALQGDEVLPHAERLPLQVTRLGARKYKDAVDHRTDPMGKPYYWIGGPPTAAEHREGDDTWAVAHARASVTPLELDITAPSLEPLQRLLQDLLDD